MFGVEQKMPVIANALTDRAKSFASILVLYVSVI